VRIPEGATEILGEPVPPGIGGRKAEIQVRTMLQHAHSEIVHDRLYRSGFTPPEDRRREAARVAAVLESADEQFAAFVGRLDAFAGHYAAHLPPEKRRREIDDLKLVLQHEPEAEKKPMLALRIARLARAAWDWPSLVECVESHLGTATAFSDCLRMEAGHALCHLHQQTPAAPGFHRGLDLLESVARSAEPADACQECDERERRATALAWLGWAHSRVPGHRAPARACLERAVELSPNNPYPLVALVELDVIARGTDDHLALLTPSLRQAVARCEEHIHAGIEVTRAWLALAKLRFLLNDPFSAFEALCLGARSAETHHPLLESVRSFEQLKDAIGTRQPAIEWLCAGAQLLARAKELNAVSHKAKFDWQPLVGRFQFDASLPVTILAGSTAREPLLLEGLAGHKGILISGGTTAGVCGLAARVESQLNSSGRAILQLVGYTPEHLPRGAEAEPGYDKLFKTVGSHKFSPLEPILMWTDLLISGVNPGNVRLFCLGGDKLAASELALAWALGGRAAVVNDATGAARRFSAVLSWAGAQAESGMLLPDDPATVTAFFSLDIPIDARQWEKSGEAAHQSYVKSQQKGARQPNLLPWSLLREDFKHSNRHQAACSVEILRRCGFVVEPVQTPPARIPLVEFSQEQTEQLAEWEHGRWNVERLKNGWRYGEKKDETRKLSPYLVPWTALPDAIKNYDRDAVRGWPAILAQAGWQVRQP
jgi:hypothetical protein